MKIMCRSKFWVATLAALLVGLQAQATIYVWDGGAGTDNWKAANNWNPDGTVVATNTVGAHRLNVNGTQLSRYTAEQGTTVYTGDPTPSSGNNRGLVIGNGDNARGYMRISGGSFSTLGSSNGDIVGNGSGAIATLIIDGGTFTGTTAGMSLGIGGGPTSSMIVSNGTATVATLTMNATIANIILAGGVLEANRIAYTAGTANMIFDGGTLRARTNSTTFLQDLSSAKVESRGAVIDTNGKTNTIAQNLLAGSTAGGGLEKTGEGTLTLSGNSTFTGATTISEGTLALGASASLNAGSSVSIATGATFDVSAISSYTWGASSGLMASGTVSSVSTIKGGTSVALNGRPVTLHFTPIAFSGDSAHPALTMSAGSLDLTGSTVAVFNTAASPLSAGDYTLVSGGTITGTVPTLDTTRGVGNGVGLAVNTPASLLIVSGNLILRVVPATTMTDLTLHGGFVSPSTYGDALQFDVIVTGANPSGTVVLKTGGSTGTTIGSGTLVNGSVTMTISPLNSLAAMTHGNIVAVYSGDPNNTSSVSSPRTQVVQPKPLTLSGAAAQNKLYDATTNAVITGTLPGVVNGDTVILNGTGYFASAGSGTGIAVTSTSTLGGASADNYVLSQPAGMTGTILASAVWSGAVDSLWGTLGNWVDSLAPNSANTVANFNTLNPVADQTVNLDAAKTVGSLVFGDTDTSTAAGWALTNNGTAGNTLTLAGTAPTVTVNALGTGKAVSISAVIAGTDGMTKSGAGTLTVNGSGQNTFTGGLKVNSGTVTLDFANQSTPSAAAPTDMIANSNPLTLAGGTLNILGKNAAGTTSTQTFASATLNPGHSPVILNKGSSSTSCTLSLGPITRVPGATVTFKPNSLWASQALSATEKVNVDGVVYNAISYPKPSSGWSYMGAGFFGNSGISPRYAQMNSTGQLALGPSGTTWVNAGSSPGNVYTFNATAIQTLTASESMYAVLINTTSSAGTLTLGNATAAYVLTLNGMLHIATQTCTFQPNSGVRGSLQIGSEKELVLNCANSGSITISAPIADNGANASSVTISSTGTGVITLSGVNTYTGPTYINSGTVSIAADTGLGAVPASATLDNIVFNGGSLSVSTATAISANRGVRLGANGGTLINAATGLSTYLGVIEGSGPLVVNSSGAGGWSFGNVDSSYTGGTTLSSGSGTIVLQASSSGSAGNPSSGPFGAGTSPLYLAGATMRSGIGGPFTIGNPVIISADTTFPSVASEVDLIFSGPVTLTANRTLIANIGATVSDKAAIFSGVISDGGNGYGITQAGTGKLTLSGTNTYTGNTTISAGTLALGTNGALNAASSVVIAAGATFDVAAISNYTWGASAGLMASGTVSSVSTIKGGTSVALNGRPVTLHFTPITFSGDSGHPALTMSAGSLDLAGSTVAVFNTAAFPLSAGDYTLVSGGTITGTEPTLDTTRGVGNGVGLAVNIPASLLIVSGNLILRVVPATTMTDLTLHSGFASPSTYGDALQFDVIVTGANPSGTVVLKTGGSTGTTIGSGTLVNGSVTITISPVNSLAAMTHDNIVAVYSGDANNASSVSSPRTQVVQPKPLTLSGATANNKLYDATTNAVISGALSGFIDGDTVTLNGTGYFASAGSGTGIAVTSTSTLGGAAASNYTLTQPTGLTGAILASAVWSGAVDSLWGSVGNWVDSLAPNSANTVANFNTLNPVADQTVNLDAAKTVGSLVFGDTDTSTAAGWALTNNGTAGNTLTLAGIAPTVTVNALGTGKAVSISAVIAGTDGMTTSGAGALTVNGSGQNTFTGGLKVNSGILTLDFSNQSTPSETDPADMIANNNALTLGGSTLIIKGRTGSVASSQTFTPGTTLNSGASIITLTQNGGTSTTLQLTSINRTNGATLNFSNVPSTSGIIAKRGTSATAGFLGAWATVGTGTSMTYASIDGSANIVTATTTTSTGSTTALITGQPTGSWSTDGTKSYQTAGLATLLNSARSINLYRSINSTPTTFSLGDTAGSHFSVNGFMNTGSGVITIQRGTAANNVVIGADKELVILGPTGVIISAPIVDNAGGASALTYSGSSALTLSGANTFSNGVFLNSGTLNINSTTALGATAGTFTINGGTIDNTTGSALVNANNNPIAINSDFTFTGGSGTTHDLNLGTGATTLGTSDGTTRDITANAGILTLGGAITNGTTANSLTKTGAGTLTLSGANSYDGVTTVLAGTLLIAHNNALGSTAEGVSIIANAALALADGVVVTGESVSYAGYGTGARGALQAAANATAEWNGPLAIGAGDSRVGAQAGGTLKISGKISNGTATALIVSADQTTGKVIVSGDSNNYTGESQIIRGTLQLGRDNALPVGSVLNVHSASGVGDVALFEMDGFSQAVAGIKRGNNEGLATIKNSSATLSTLTVTNTSSYTFDSLIAGRLELIKRGLGTLTLSGQNTYSNGTTVAEGTLVLTAANAGGTGNLTVANGATCTVTSASSAIADTATVSLGASGVMNLNMGEGVTETVRCLYINGVQQGAGVWNVERDPVRFAGNGSLVVLVGAPTRVSFF